MKLSRQDVRHSCGGHLQYDNCCTWNATFQLYVDNPFYFFGKNSLINTQTCKIPRFNISPTIMVIYLHVKFETNWLRRFELEFLNQKVSIHVSTLLDVQSTCSLTPSILQNSH